LTALAKLAQVLGLDPFQYLLITIGGSWSDLVHVITDVASPAAASGCVGGRS
jgi:hypothetical protein